jgi:antitoxin VapB
MPLNIRNEEVNRLAEQLAAIKHITKTDAVMFALKEELRRTVEAVPLMEQIRILQDRILAYPPTGKEADKAFFDSLSGDD